MKRKPKSAPFMGLLAAAGFLAFAGCDQINWPHVYGPNEVPQSVADAPRPFDVPPQPPPDQRTYPLLGDVPSRPKDFTTQTAVDQAKQQMEDDRAEAQVLQQQAATPSVVPAPVAPGTDDGSPASKN